MCTMEILFFFSFSVCLSESMSCWWWLGGSSGNRIKRRHRRRRGGGEMFILHKIRSPPQLNMRRTRYEYCVLLHMHGRAHATKKNLTRLNRLLVVERIIVFIMIVTFFFFYIRVLFYAHRIFGRPLKCKQFAFCVFKWTTGRRFKRWSNIFS